jgi:pyruvate/2-oxoglutarate/acetoin dehydrogenase E1 component
MVQPQGHSTSGSHERYKSKERLEWESEYDPLKKMREWILENKIATSTELDEIEDAALNEAQQAQQNAWNEYLEPIKKEREQLVKLVTDKPCTCKTGGSNRINLLISQLQQLKSPFRRDILSTARKIQRHICNECPILSDVEINLKHWINERKLENFERYNDKLYNDSIYSALNVESVEPTYSDNSPTVHGREIIRDNFEALFKKNPLLITFGEDSGKIGDVNQGLEGLQDKFGENRITDTGIREATIVGQGIGMALRGLRPIAEIQYLDYIYYAIQTLSDDVASTHWRSKGSQSVPLIIRTRGHRLEGIWHSGSPMGMILNAIRGIYVCVPRNMTQAAGFYNTLLEGQDPALVIEPLNAYRLDEKRPENLGEYKIPLGTPEILEAGRDITLVTYGSCVRIAQEAVKQLKEFNILVELIDVQTLLPFDINETIVESVKKTNRVVFLDEDVPGGASAYMMQKVIEEQGAFKYLDSAPKTITAKEHRPAYASDGDYFSKPNTEDVFESIYEIMRDVNPGMYREI